MYTEFMLWDCGLGLHDHRISRPWHESELLPTKQAMPRNEHQRTQATGLALALAPVHESRAKTKNARGKQSQRAADRANVTTRGMYSRGVRTTATDKGQQLANVLSYYESLSNSHVLKNVQSNYTLM